MITTSNDCASTGSAVGTTTFLPSEYARPPCWWPNLSSARMLLPARTDRTWWCPPVRTGLKLSLTLSVSLTLGLLNGCGHNGPSAGPGAAITRPSRAPRAPMEVVVSAYPLAVLVSYVGGKAVKVVDLA